MEHSLITMYNVSTEYQRDAEAGILNRELLQRLDLFDSTNVECSAGFAFSHEGTEIRTLRIARDEIFTGMQIDLTYFLF